MVMIVIAHMAGIFWQSIQKIVILSWEWVIVVMVLSVIMQKKLWTTLDFEIVASIEI